MGANATAEAVALTRYAHSVGATMEAASLYAKLKEDEKAQNYYRATISKVKAKGSRATPEELGYAARARLELLAPLEEAFEKSPLRLPEQQLQAFAREKIDIGFTRPLSAADERNLTQERIYRDRLMLAVPDSHALAGAGKVRLARFAGEDFVMFKRSEAPKLADAMTQLCASAGFTPQIVSELPMIQTMLMAVAAGIGVALVPGCVRSFRQPGVTILPVSPVSPHMDLVLTRPKGEPSPTVSACLELVREHLPRIRREMEDGV